MTYQGKTVWITGASSGIGEQLAYAWTKAGAKVILSSRRRESLEAVKANCPAGSVLDIVPIDMAQYRTLTGIVQSVILKHGHIDILVNNAGVSQRALVKDTTLEVDEQLIQTNYLGTIALTKAVLPFMLERGSGHFVTITSLTGKFGSPLRSSYAGSKHALHGFFDSLRAEVNKHGVGVTLICPGYIRTNVSINALTGSGAPQNTMDEATGQGMDPADLAQKILKAVAKGKLEAYFGGKEVLGVYIKRLFPNWFAGIIEKTKVT